MSPHVWFLARLRFSLVLVLTLSSMGFAVRTRRQVERHIEIEVGSSASESMNYEQGRLHDEPNGWWSWVWPIVTRSQMPPVQIHSPSFRCQGFVPCFAAMGKNLLRVFKFIGSQTVFLLSDPTSWPLQIQSALETEIRVFTEVAHAWIGLWPSVVNSIAWVLLWIVKCSVC